MIATQAPGSGGVEPALAFALADGLVDLTRQLGELAYDLGTDPDTLRRHMESLQAIDRITQAQIAIADILRDAAPAERRLAAVPLDALAADLAGKLSHYRATLHEADEAA